jgi:hypothetical protein
MQKSSVPRVAAVVRARARLGRKSSYVYVVAAVMY